MMYNDNQLFQNAYNYAKNRNLKVQRQELLGHGSDGAVWKSSVPSAIKALYRKKNFEAELECYRRLKAQNIRTIHGLNIPVLEGWDTGLQVIEITFVRPPYFLDFGKVHIDHAPDGYYDSQFYSNALAGWRDLFGDRWKDVAAVLGVLKSKFGIYYMDPRPGNINFGDEDGDDWMAEPGIDYRDYE